jgi:hypothetical protein
VIFQFPVARAALGMLALLALPAMAAAQLMSGVVVDQTGLPLPGVQIEVHHGDTVESTTISGSDGTFALTKPTDPDDVVVATLDGFESARVPIARAGRITLEIAHATESTEVVASALTSSGAAMETLGSRMTASLAQRLPEPRPRILQSLPLLPSVVRGPDGLLRIGGTRPHESSLWIDGFDVTDPVTLTSAIDLPNESVKGMAVLREPTAATFSGTLGSLASIETAPGGDKFSAGVQGFIPRPRLSNSYGLGRIEAFFPRAYAGGKWKDLHFFGSTEFNYERVPVPGVTDRSGSPSSGLTGTSSFLRIDMPLSASNNLTFEGIVAPSHATAVGLSPLTEPAAAPDIFNRDLFFGVVDHIVLNPTVLLTLRAGVGEHRTEVQSSSRDTAIFAPDGWHQNFFAEVQDSGVRRAASATLDKSGINRLGNHTLSFSLDLRQRSMSGSIETHPIVIRDDIGRTTRFIVTSQVPSIQADDTTAGLGVRDLWVPTSRLQFDLNVRSDFPTHEKAAFSPRFAASYTFDNKAQTAIKASLGRFVGRVPLGALGFNQLGGRIDLSFVPGTDTVIARRVFRPTLGFLNLPHADMMSIEVEHRVLPTLELQAAFRRRTGFDLPTVTVTPFVSTTVASTGTSEYKEFAISARQTWRADRELFVSYVRSTSMGDVNDYGTLVTNLDVPLFEPAGQAPLPTDTPHRVRGWATFQFPNEIVVSPAVEWRTGFPYSLVDVYRHYVGNANSERFPNYFSLDITTFKTFDIIGRKWDLGLQFFNVTGHFNPRDVISVVGTPQFGEFSNSFGVTLGGYMRVRW